MTGYFRCCGCGHQWKLTVDVYNSAPCEKCGGKRKDAILGGPKPAWFVEDKKP